MNDVASTVSEKKPEASEEERLQLTIGEVTIIKNDIIDGCTDRARAGGVINRTVIVSHSETLLRREGKDCISFEMAKATLRHNKRGGGTSVRIVGTSRFRRSNNDIVVRMLEFELTYLDAPHALPILWRVRD